MFRDNYVENQNMTPNTKTIEKLKADFPEFFGKDGEFLMDRFRKVLKQDEIEISKEGYELNFLGKSYARYLSSTKPETFIAPHVKDNEKDENKNSENLYIIGDNIDALKHLLGSYSRKIKCIYIDPPYNTGSDGFVYPDNFQYDAKKLSEMIGIEEEEAERIINLKGKSSHSAWLTFMYPRLILARELLSDDGVIFISIDDNEQANLKLMCDEIFGEENFIETLIWKRRATPPNDRIIGKNHEYIFVVSKNCNLYKLNLQKRSKKLNSSYINRDNDSRGPWNYADLSGNGKGGRIVESCIYPIIDPITNEEHYPPQNKCWLYNKEKMKELINDNRIVFRGDKRTPYQKKFLSEVRNGSTLATLIEDVEYSINIDKCGTSQTSSKEIKSLFANDIFEFPKPVKLLQKILIAGSAKDSVILDFFSGSATTAHAVMELNAEDNGNRKCILVQIPEVILNTKPAYKAGYRTIDQIGRDRIIKAAKIIKEKNKNIDCGFKTYSLFTINDEIITKLEEFKPSIKLLEDDMVSIFNTENCNGKDAILSTFLVTDGYGLSEGTEKYTLVNYKADIIKDSLYLIDNNLKSEDVMELIKRIENFEIDINRIVVYAYSINFSTMHELKKNLSNLRNNKYIELIERY